MDLVEFLKQNPEYKKILELAVAQEESHKDKPYWGWTWSDVQAYPAKLMKLVVNGIIQVKYKSNKNTGYLLVDKDAVKEALNQTNWKNSQ